mmetsp:Transcript_113042/g.330377  ORF Transcript_113042/g.330377 Transcript_113042/m.330377 type:complete len:200 (+) Transcript_113042:391-990(+)
MPASSRLPTGTASLQSSPESTRRTRRQPKPTTGSQSRDCPCSRPWTACPSGNTSSRARTAGRTRFMSVIRQSSNTPTSWLLGTRSTACGRGSSTRIAPPSRASRARAPPCRSSTRSISSGCCSTSAFLGRRLTPSWTLSTVARGSCSMWRRIRQSRRIWLRTRSMPTSWRGCAQTSQSSTRVSSTRTAGRRPWMLAGPP